MDEGALDQALARLELAIGSVEPQSLRKDLLLDARALRLESWRPTTLLARVRARLRALARHPELAEACAGIDRALG